MLRFVRLLEITPNDSILDVGGTPYNWDLLKLNNPIVLLNIFPKPNSVQLSSPQMTWVVGDGTALEYADQRFDVCFSNSVIEHVGDFEKQRLFANEILRVGKKVWMQTPARSFFLEPHYLTPFVHWLPKKWQVKILRNFSVWGLLVRPTTEYVKNFVDQTRLINFEELKILFPDCMIIKERFLFMTKSYVVVRNTT